MVNTQRIKFKVPENSQDLGKRLDLYLSFHLSEFSRAFIKKIIETNQVLVNGEICYKAGYKVKPGDVIEFPKLEYRPFSINLEPSSFDLDIIYEDNDYLIINKPIGLAVHPTNSYHKETLVNKLLSKYEDLPKNCISRPGIVHRLDKDTSGIIAVAKSPRALWWLSSQFAERKVLKKYLSIGIAFGGCSQKLNQKEFRIEGYIFRNINNRKQFILLDNKNGKNRQAKYSLSFFKVLDEVEVQDNIKLVYMEIIPKTGRTHQIRVHQKAIGIPILGDNIYLSQKQKKWCDLFLKKNSFHNRLYLHSLSLTFQNYDGKVYSFSTEIPESFKRVLRNAKKKKN